MKFKFIIAISAFAVALTAAGTTEAAFNDYETSSNNFFQAGTLDIQIGWDESLNSDLIEIQKPTDNPGPIFNQTNIERGDSGEATIEIDNNANPGFLWFTANQTGNKENQVKVPKEDDDKKQKTYYEVDFVGEHPLKQQNGESYRKQNRLIRRIKGKALEQPNDRESPEQDECVPTSQEIEVKNGYAHVKFDVKNKDECGTGTTVSLVSYAKNYSQWTEEKEGEKLYDSYTETFEPYTGEHKIKVKLPPKDYFHNYSETKTKKLVIDDFEDGDLKEYKRKTSEFQITDETAVKGSSLKFKRGYGKVDERRADIYSKSGLNAYPKQGDRIIYYAKSGVKEYIEPDSRSNFKFGYQDSDNYYKIMTNFHHSDNWFLYKLEDGNAKQLDVDTDVDGDFSKDWNRIEIDWGKDGSIQARIYSEDGEKVKSVLEAQDDEYKKGGIGLTGISGSEKHHNRIYHDEIHLERPVKKDKEEEEICEDETPEEGELGENLRFTVWHDDGDNVLANDESVIFEGTAHQLGEFLNGEGKLLDYNPEKSGIQPVPGNDRKFIGFKWKLPEDAGCEIQTDSKTFDFKFELRQSRHNGNPFLKTLFFGDEEISKNNLFKAGNFTDSDEKSTEEVEYIAEEENTNPTIDKDTDFKNAEYEEPENKLLAHWSLDGAMFEVEDSAQDHDAVNRGATRSAPGKINNSFIFDGSDHLKVEASEDFRLKDGTVSFWVNMNDSSSNWMFSKDKNGCEEDCGHLSIAYNSFISENKLGVRLKNNGTNKGYRLTENEDVESFQPGKWNHVSVSFGDKGMKLYINGKLHDSNQRTTGINGDQLPIFLGSRYDGKRGLNGRMDEIKIHNYQLNQSKITQIHERNEN